MPNKNDILAISSHAEFSEMAMKIFDFQSVNCEVFKRYLEILGRKKPSCVEEIPFLPIDFFKKHDVASQSITASNSFFLSSGTGSSARSKHWVVDMDFYLESCLKSYTKYIGDPENQVILALLPNYMDQGNSGLVCMVQYLIEKTGDESSGFLLGHLEEVKDRYEAASKRGKEVIIFGVSYSLMDLADLNFSLESALIIETGGMKGRREELPKKMLHSYIKKGTSCYQMFSEYGMTELFSQAYAKENLIFSAPPWMKIITTDPTDPFTLVENRRGVINVIDLANVDTCSFIQTQDIGINSLLGFTIEGRLQHADIRGCNQLVE